MASMPWRYGKKSSVNISQKMHPAPHMSTPCKEDVVTQVCREQFEVAVTEKEVRRQDEAESTHRYHWTNGERGCRDQCVEAAAAEVE
jgi:hypothetical protein